jgi:hypothetical protein
MKIYVVTHFYDNGESYEDYMEYEDHLYFSTFKKASYSFWKKVSDDYEGKFVLEAVELDTQVKEILEESPWIKCTSYYDEEWPEECEYDYDPEYDPGVYYSNPMGSYKEYWEWEDDTSYDDISEEEDRAWFEYVNTPGTNYQIIKEIEDELIRRKEAMMINFNPDSVKLLDEVVKLLGIKFDEE